MAGWRRMLRTLKICTIEPVTAATGVAIRATVIGSRAMTAILLSLLGYVHKDDCYPDTACWIYGTPNPYQVIGREKDVVSVRRTVRDWECRRSNRRYLGSSHQSLSGHRRGEGCCLCA